MSRVFVLCTGRCGSVTFAKACGHVTNYSVGHETIGLRHGLDYPDNHIEANNRLIFYLGLLRSKFPAARYVHLVRDEQATARSYAARSLDKPWRLPAMWRYGVRMGWYVNQGKDVERSIEQDCREMVAAMNSLIELGLSDLPALRVRIEEPTDFRRFWEWAGCVGDAHAALETFRQKHNAT